MARLAAILAKHQAIDNLAIAAAIGVCYCPVLPFLCVWGEFLVLRPCEDFPFFFLSVFPFFSRDMRGFGMDKQLLFGGGLPCFSPPKKQGKERRQGGKLPLRSKGN